MLWCMIWRWRTVSAAQGCWVEGIVARVWQAPYRSEHSAWRNPAIRHIPAYGKVSGFLRHGIGGDERLKKDSGREENRMEYCCTRSGVETVMMCCWLMVVKCVN